VKWHFDENEKLAETSGEDMKGINKRRAREYHVSGRERTRAPSAEIAAARAAVELRRFKLVKRLRHQLALKCGALGLSGPPLLVFERWLARAMLEGTRGVPTPMLPAVDAGGGLGRDLQRAGVEDLAAADAAAAELAAASAALAAKLEGDDGSDSDEEARNAAKVQLAEDQAAKVVADDAGPLLALKVNDAKPYMTVSKAHAGKLRALYCRHSLGGAPLPPEGTPEHAAFLGSTFAMLARYEAMGGAGYQAALGETAFDVLKKRLGVGCEAFASPLNCRYGRFCSAFPDVDGAFGSLGSFFEFRPERGSFEMNPPFVPETLLKAAEHANTLLDAAEKANGRLSFVVVIPAWRDVKAWAALEGSAHRRGEPLVVPAAEHGFCDGAQHCRPPAERHRVSSYDTGVFFLQTTNGARRWPVTDEVRGELKAAMARAVGSARTVKDLERRYRGKPGRGDRPGDRPGDQPGAGFPTEKLRIEIRDDARNGDARAGDDGGEGGDKKRRRRRRKHE
jgi:phosphorylated CTD-interacting factor 1